MLPRERGLDITKNIRMIEWLKSEILMSVAQLHSLLATGVRNGQESLADVLASVIINAYLLARRLGIGFAALDQRVNDQVKASAAKDHRSEEWYDDMSAMAEYLRSRNS